jgi:transcriptional accessory protein Tex/SPT6
VKIGQTVHVNVLEVDLERKRIALSMRGTPERGPQGRDAAGSGARKQGGPQQHPPADKQKERSAKRTEGLDPNNPFVKAFKKANWSPH